MPDQISTVLIPCVVVQMNNQVFITEEQIIGQPLDVPCRNALIDDIDYWAVPIKDYGILDTSTLDYILAIDDDINPPTFDSFKVVRVRDKLSGNTWWIYGTKSDFISSCSTCCDSPSIPMPGIINGFAKRIEPCDNICLQNVNGVYYSVWGLPTLNGGEHYFPFGSFNNQPLFPASASGYATVNSLLTFLNTHWTPFVWTASTDNLTLFATGGTLNDSLCVSVVPLVPSV